MAPPDERTASPPGDATETAADPASYAVALTELDSILRRLESEDVDVDRLVDDVARAARLLSWCRARLDRATLEIEQVVADLDPGDEGT